MTGPWTAIADRTKTVHEHMLVGCGDVQNCQTALLAELLRSCADTDQGRQLNFSALCVSSSLVFDFQNQIPIHGYDEVEPLILQQMAGADALLKGNVLFYERTGGSSGGAKYIPYTERALQLLQAAIEPWLHDLLIQRPEVAGGPAYWSVSPALHASATTKDGTPIGASSDLVFMRDELQLPFAQTLVDMSLIQMAQDYEQWQKYTLLTLALHENLRLFSIWSPTFLSVLLSSFATHLKWLQAVLRNPATQGLGACALLQDLSRNAQAAERLALAQSDESGSQAALTRCLWPHLDTISCWTHGPAVGAFQELRRWFPETFIQPKGLIATEGVVSIPLHGASYPVLAINSGFFEFVDQDGTVSLSDTLVENQCYRVLMSNASGLFRYDIGDQVRVRGFFHQAPMIEFVGRSSNTSDLVGEKLHEAFVSQCLSVFTDACILAPNLDHYRLYLDKSGNENISVDSLAADIEAKLCENPQYRYAREIGQLNPVCVCLVPNLASEQLDWHRQQGLIVGDIKPAVLCTNVNLIRHLNNLQVGAVHQ